MKDKNKAMANGIKKWALTTSWKALHQGDVFLGFLFSNETKSVFPGSVMNGGAAELPAADQEASMAGFMLHI